MQNVNSLDELKQLKLKLDHERDETFKSIQGEIIISAGSASYAAGYLDTLHVIKHYLEKNKLENITVHITGALGTESAEPIIEISYHPFPKRRFGGVDANSVETLLDAYFNQTQIPDKHALSD